MNPEARELVGIIVFDGEKFLLLHRVMNWRGWEFPKGGIDAEEPIEKALARELFEETGLKDFELVGKVDEFVFFDKKRVHKTHAVVFLVRVASTSRVSFENQALVDGKRLVEHDYFKWFLPAEAVKTLTHNDTKNSLKKAIKMLGLSG